MYAYICLLIAENPPANIWYNSNISAIEWLNSWFKQGGRHNTRSSSLLMSLFLGTGHGFLNRFCLGFKYLIILNTIFWPMLKQGLIGNFTSKKYIMQNRIEERIFLRGEWKGVKEEVGCRDAKKNELLMKTLRF